MSKTGIFCIIAAGITVLGLLIALVPLILVRFDFHQFSTQVNQTNTHEFTEPIENIDIDIRTSDIRLEKSEDQACRVTCEESDLVSHEVTLQDGTLSVKRKDNRRWYHHIGINNDNYSVTLYLPTSAYQLLTVNGSTGKVTVPKDFTFKSISVKLSTGKIDCSASASEHIRLEVSTGRITAKDLSANCLECIATTGNIKLQNLSISGDVTLECDTGEIHATNLQAASLKAKSTTGDQTYESVTLSGAINLEASTGDVSLTQAMARGDCIIKTSTGDVRFDRADATALSVKTTTGSVKGTLLSPKIFYTHTSTGSIDVPKSTEGGMCEITTNTGSIHISIA